ncbi:MAG: autotransporter domain-containing protein [Methyloprofundus sp.]|nr:autotransporter domain-containing protein [Methyloprofundus sp.]
MVQITKKIKRADSWANWRLLRTLMLCGGAGLSGSVNAADTVLGNAGQTELQQTTGDLISKVCKRLAGTYAPPKKVDPAENPAQDLFNQCNAMIQTAAGTNVAGNNLGIDEDQLASAPQNVANEEMATPSRNATSTLSGQIAEVNSHLFDIHKISQSVGGSSGDDDRSLLDNRLSFFVNGVGGFGDIKASDRENSSDFYSAGVVLGLDYRFTNNFVSGVAFGYSHLDSDFQNNINVSGGGVDSDMYNLSIFAAYDLADFYVDGTFTYGWSDYDIERGVVILESDDSTSKGGSNRVAKADADGEQYSAGLGFGYNYNYNAFNINPYFRLDYYHGTIDSYTETGAYGLNLAVDEQNFDSLQTLLGVQLAYAFSHSYGVFIPQFNVGWHHEILNDSRAINARYVAADEDLGSDNPTLTALTDNPDRDFATLGFGFSNVFQGGVQVFFNYQALLGYRNVSSNGFTGGVRFEF